MVVGGFVYSYIKKVISLQRHIVGDWLNICGRTNFCIFCLFFCFKVKNSEDLLQVQTVFHPAEKRTGRCKNTHTHTRKNIVVLVGIM